jgi:hypothetical protein
MEITAVSVSPRITITAEDFRLRRPGGISKIYRGIVNPPVIDKTGVFSSQAINQQVYPTWNFEKIAEPRYEGVAAFMGTPSNRPEFVSEHHIIGILRSIDLYLAPKYAGFIKTRTKTPRPAVPPRG